MSIYTGTISVTVASSSLPGRTWSSFNFGFPQSSITWDLASTKALFPNYTISQLVPPYFTDTKYYIKLELNGYQNICAGAGSVAKDMFCIIEVYYNDSWGTVHDTVTVQGSPQSGICGGSTGVDANYNWTGYLPSMSYQDRLPTAVLYYPDISDSVGIHWTEPTIYGSLTATLYISTTFTCSGLNLEGDICFNYLKNNYNQGLPKYLDYCFDPKYSYPIQDTLSKCQTYLESYLSVQGNNPNNDIDTKLQDYCVRKYKDITTYYANAPKNGDDMRLCACHLDPAEYCKWKNTIFDNNPQFANVIGEQALGNDYCMFKECLGEAVWRSTNRNPPGGECPVPQCINFADFTNYGTYSGTISVSQNSQCAGLYNTTNNTTPTPTPSASTFYQSHKVAIYVTLGILVLCFISIILLIFI